MRKLIAVIGLLIAAPVFAQEIPDPPIVDAQLIVHAPEKIQKGSAFRAAVLLNMPEGWHVYWQNPGDSGIAPTIEWTLPDGLKASPIDWPTPERIEITGIVNYGYSEHVLLSSAVLAEKDIESGEIKAKVDWLVCKDVCIPESAELSVFLPSSNPQGAALISTALENLPGGGDAPALAFYKEEGENVLLLFNEIFTTDDDVTSAYWFPVDDGVISNASPQELTIEHTGHASPKHVSLWLKAKRGSGDLPKAWRGVLVTQSAKGKQAQYLAAELEPRLQQGSPVSGYLLILLFAFLGGLILNIMPCVLPILSLKALAIAKKSGAEQGEVRKQGLAYTAGVIASFLAVAGVMLALKSAGAAIGWGFQLQEPLVVLALFILMVVVALNLLGTFEMPVLFGSRASEGNAFFTGVLAVALATPCTAPFMAGAIGATLLLPTAQSLLVFASLGLGMASPFLLISFWPAARRLLPKPGAWMLTFKKLLAVPVILTAVWLFTVLLHLRTMDSPSESRGTKFDRVQLDALREAGKPVFVDATAAWCITCKINERVALNSDSVQQYFKEHGVTLMVADWTMRDATITQYLADFGRNGVPIYVYYPTSGEPIVLPQILTPSIVIDSISHAETKE